MTQIILLLTFISLFNANSFAQEKAIYVQGKVVDENTYLPLQRASIFIRGKSIGTISNDEGEFDFKAPSLYKNDTLTISYLGYESYNEVLSKINTNIFALKPSAVLLAEVEVKDVTAENIVRQALENIDKNYPVTPYILKAFYRDLKLSETFEPDSAKISLLEAALSIYDRGYRKSNNKSLKEDVFLDEIRRNKSPGTIYNYLDLLLKQNYVRHNRSKNIGGITSLFDFKGGLTYQIKRKFKQGLEHVYLISAVLFNKLGEYEIFINETDLAFMQINFKGKMAGDSVLGKEPMPWIQKTNQLVFIDNTLIFRKYNNVYFPNYIKLNWHTRTLSDVTNEVTEKKEFFLELLVNEIITDKAEAKKASLKSPMSARTSLEKQVKPYNEVFWENFNIVKENPLDKRLVKLLEKSGSMEDQFKNQKADPSIRKNKKSNLKENMAEEDIIRH